MIVQVPPAATELPHVFVCANSAASAPEIPMLVTLIAALPVLLRITGKAALVVLTVCEGNVSEAGERLATGFVLAAPVPSRATLCGLLLALSEIARLAVRGPVPEGLKVSESAQLFPAAKPLPQVFVWEKSVAFTPVTEI